MFRNINIIRLLFPPKCIFCGSILDITIKSHICERCHKQIPFYREKISNENREIFRSLYCDDMVFVCEYIGIIKDAIIKFKFFNKPSYYRAFEEILREKLDKLKITQSFSAVMSVPLHKKRESERGYNQSLLISRALSKHTGIPEISGCVERIKNTGSQSLLPKDKRIINVKDAFIVKAEEKIKGKKIILIDDILTTGSTIDECCRVLKKAGACSVTAAVIASGRKY